MSGLLSDVTQACIDNHLKHVPQYIFQDVRDAIEYVHGSGSFHNAVIAKPERYIEPNPHLAVYLHELRKAGKRVSI